MKNLFCLISLLALLVSGCSEEEMLRNGTSASGGRVFTTSFENDESRTYLENGLYSRWTEGDRISLFDASTLNSQYLFAGETGDDGGTFFRLSKPEGTGTALSANYAVYPYDKDMTISADGAITLTLPSTQHYAENSYGLGDNTMVAVTEDADDTFLQFKNVGGCFKFQLYGDDVTVKSITLMGNNGEKIAGKATLAPAYDKAPVVTMADDATTSITLDCGEKGVKIGASAEEATAFWVVVPPTTFEEGITITVKDMVGKVFTQTTDKQLAIGRNVVKPMAAVKAVVTESTENVVYEIPEEKLNGWDFGYVLNQEYIVGYIDDNQTIVTMINKNDGKEEDGLIICMDENGIVTSIGGIGSLYDVDYDENNIILHRINDEGLYEEEKLPYSNTEQYNAMARVAGVDFNLIIKGINFIGTIQSSVFITSDLKNWDWWSTLKDGSLAAADFIISKNPYGAGLVALKTVGLWVVDHYRNQNYERQRKALYNQCDIQIDEIRNEKGGCTVYVTVNNANTLYDYLVNMYEPVENESTRNLVYCGILVRSSNEYVTTRLNDYQSSEILLNGEFKYGSVANLSFTLPEVILDKSHTTLYFRPYLKSKRIQTSKGDVEEGYIKYGNTVPYECFTGKIIEFKQYWSEYGTDANNGVVTFNTTVHASINSVKGLEEWGVYVYNPNSYKKYDYYPSEFRASKLEDFIDIQFKINKADFDEINSSEYFASKNVEIGVYKKLENPTGNFDYLTYFYSECETHELVYDHKPSLTFTSASVGGTSVLDEDDGDFYYATDVSIAYQVNGSFWFDNLNFGLPSDVTDKVGLVEIENGDGLYKGDYYWTYWSSSSSIPFVYLIGNLSSGGTFVSDNMLTFHGMPISSVYITGNGSSTKQQSNTLNVGAKTRSSSFIKK